MRRLTHKSIRQLLLPFHSIFSQVFDGLLSGFPNFFRLLLPFLGLFRFLSLRRLVVLGRVFYRLESRRGELFVVCRIFGFLGC